VRVVLDTNTLVSALLSPSGPPRRLLDGARAQVFNLCSSLVLMAELLDVISRDKFACRLAAAGLTPLGIVGELRRLATMATPIDTPRVVTKDADDDHVLACAVAAQANLIVTGDKHLLGLGDSYQSIAIVTPAQAISLVFR
jgi:putative PIN family toxin of toxin-antitoxin system